MGVYLEIYTVQEYLREGRIWKREAEFFNNYGFIAFNC